jgi:hypothetical protein
MQWIVDRKVKIERVNMGFGSGQETENNKAFLACVGPAVLDLTVSDEDKALGAICHAAAATCVHLRVLSLLALPWHYGDTLDPPVRELIAQRASTLERLSCEGYDMSKLLPEDKAMVSLQYLALHSGVDSANVCTFVHNCPRLLYFCCSYLDSDDCLRVLAESCPNLVSLSYGYSGGAVRTGNTDNLKAVLLACENLTTVNFTGREGFTNSHLAVVAQHCKKLTSIEFFAGPGLSGGAINILEPRLPELRHLRINSLNLWSDGPLRLLTQHCRQLRSLSLCCLRGRYTSADLVALFNALPCLEDLDIGKVEHLTDSVLIAIGKNGANLRTLDLSEASGFTDNGVAALVKSCPLIECIYLKLDGGLFNKSMQSVWQALRPKLQFLDMYSRYMDIRKNVE